MSKRLSVRVSQIQDMKAQKVEMRVPLYSYGCERKIRKALSHFRGLSSVDVDFCQQKVSVTGVFNRDEVFAAIKAKRKNAEFWPSDVDLTFCKTEQMDPQSAKDKIPSADFRDKPCISENPGDSNNTKPATAKKKKKVTFKDEQQILI